MNVDQIVTDIHGILLTQLVELIKSSAMQGLCLIFKLDFFTSMCYVLWLISQG